MPSPLTVKRNTYLDNPKRSNVYTPAPLAEYLARVVGPAGVVFDPAIGGGRLTAPFRRSGSLIIGCDINPDSASQCDRFIPGPFEKVKAWTEERPDLVICNPPFNAAPGRQLYPEVFLRTIFQLFGNDIPVVMITPMGFRLNQRRRSTRWRWVRDTATISSLLALPLDVFDNVQFHAEVLFFNCPSLPPHLWLTDDVLMEINNTVTGE